MRPKMTAIKVEGQADLWSGEHVISGTIGKLHGQRVLYLNVGNDRTLVVGIETLDRILDLLIRKREQLQEAILADESHQ